MSDLITIYIDDIPYQVSKSDNLLANVLSQNLNLPYFCWHPSMGSVGACRQCAVTQYQDENDTRGRIVMSCMTPVSDGMRIGLDDKSSAKFREQVIGAMMTNHPHDCPVCAEGGECHLQDMTVMTGHTARSYEGTKRTFTNQNLGEFVGHEMNRCITCYRCVRFYKDYAGGKDFGVYGSKNQVYFGRQKDGALESEFSGNLVEVCPTGVFTNKLFSAHYTRKWDLQSAPSVCAHCSVGCNTSIGERYGSVRRVMNRYNRDINGYFLCDKGRFGIGFVNGENRIRLVKGISQASPTGLSELDVNKALVHIEKEKFIGIGSGRASFEANSYLKTLVGAESFSLGYTNHQMTLAVEHSLLLAQHQMTSLSKAEECDLVLIFGEDITQTSPRVALSVRQALRNDSFEKAQKIGIPKWQDDAVRTCGGNSYTPLYSLNAVSTKLDDVGKRAITILPSDIENIVLALTEKLSNKASENFDSLTAEYQQLVHDIVVSIGNSRKPLIVSGWSLQSPKLINAINQLIHAIKELENTQPALIVTPDEVNSVGLLSLMDENSMSVETVIESLASSDNGSADSIVILENTLNRLSQSQRELIRKHSKTLVVLDHSEHELCQEADFVLPTAPVSENSGHFVNYQGLVQPFYQVHPSKLPVQENWRWLSLMSRAINNYKFIDSKSKTLSFKPKSIHELQRQLAAINPNFKIAEEYNEGIRKVARQTHRTSGRTSQMANITVHEVKAPQHLDDQYAFSMEGDKPANSSNMPFAWAPGWNSNQSITQFQESVGGDLDKPQPKIFISFPDTENLRLKWKNHALESEDRNDFVIVNQFHWYNSEWQSHLNPEFSSLASEKSITVSPKTADKLQLKVGQYAVLKANTYYQVALLHIESTLPDQLVQVSNSILFSQADSRELQISPATEHEITTYKQSVIDNKNEATLTKQRILESLKQQDQHIPIRLMVGGLDDC